MRSIVINVASFANVGPLGEFRILAYLVCALRFVIALKLTEEEQDNLDIWLAPLGAQEINPYSGRVRLCFMAGERELCRIPLRVLLHAESASLSRCN